MTPQRTNTVRDYKPSMPAHGENGHYVDGILLDEFTGDDVLPALFVEDPQELGSVRGLAYAVLELAAFDRYRYRRRRAGRPLEPWMLVDNWTPGDGREAEAWLDAFGDPDQPFTLGWVRSVLRRS